MIVMEVEGVGGQELLDLSDRFKQRSAPAAIVLGSREDGNANLVVNFDQTVADEALGRRRRQGDRADRRRRRRRAPDDGPCRRQGARRSCPTRSPAPAS